MDALENLPAHSPLGASSAHMWMSCPGSVTLIAALRAQPGYEEVDPDYRRDGTQAHALAAHCLERDIDAWEADAGEFPELTADMLDAVQEYLTYVRSRPGKRSIELKMHVPEFHPQAFSTLDCALEDEPNETVEVDDYKHGVGVVVDAEDNAQGAYYLFMYVAKRPWIKDHWKAVFVIIQPRAFHPDGTIRTWETTVGHIRRWAETELRPAMEATKDLDYLALGQWCRFCPAKLVCPAYEGLARKGLQGSTPLSYAEAQQLKMLVRAVEDAAYTALMNGGKPEEVGAKLVSKRADRVFKTDAPVQDRFGDDAWERKLRSPAQIEKLPGGKHFVAEFAFRPETGFTVAALDDKRSAMVVKTLDEKYGDPAQYA